MDFKPFKKFLLILPTFIAFYGCSSFPINKTSRLSLENLEKIIPGTTTKKEVENILGIPDKIFSWAQEKGGGTSALYFERPDSYRISISYEKTSDIVSGKTWYLNDDESLQNVKNILATYPDAKFEGEYTPHVSHNLPDEIYFKDAHLGMSFLYSKSLKKVSAISWSDKNADLASRAPNQAKSKSKLKITDFN